MVILTVWLQSTVNDKMRQYVCRFDLRKAQTRQHIVKGLLLALADLDKVVVTVRAAKDGAAASKDLQQEFGLSPEQVQMPTSL